MLGERVLGEEVRHANITPPEGEQVTGGAGVRRYQLTCVTAVLAASIPYFWVAFDEWTGRIDPLRLGPGDTNPIYDVQARAIMHGHLSIPPGSIGLEAFLAHGHQYTYFGILPSLLRIPIFLFTSSLDGKLFGLSITAAWICTAVFCSLLLWRLRILLRGNVPLGWLEATSYGVFLAAIMVGSVLVYLASTPDAFAEDEAWSVALFCGVLFALVGVIERPSWGRITLCGSLALLTNLNRATTGYAAVVAILLLALWFGLGREGRAQRHWAPPLVGAALVPLAIGCAIDLAKFGVPLGVPFSSQELFTVFDLKRFNGGRYTSLHWLPSTFSAYVNPGTFHLSSVFPYVSPPATPKGLFGGYVTASIPLSMPLLFLSGLWGVITTFMPGRAKPFPVLRLLLIAAALPAGALMLYGWIFERFVADFVPLLVLAGMIGMVDLPSRLSSRSRTTRAFVPVVIGALALISIWVNIGFSISPNQFWSSTQSANFINAQRAFSDATGHPLDHKVVVGWQFPAPEPEGTLFVKGRCSALYIAYQTVPPPYIAGEAWPGLVFRLAPRATLGAPLLYYSKVEQAPHTPICDSLMANHRDDAVPRK